MKKGILEILQNFFFNKVAKKKKKKKKNWEKKYQ